MSAARYQAIRYGLGWAVAEVSDGCIVWRDVETFAEACTVARELEAEGIAGDVDKCIDCGGTLAGLGEVNQCKRCEAGRDDPESGNDPHTPDQQCAACGEWVPGWGLLSCCRAVLPTPDPTP